MIGSMLGKVMALITVLCLTVSGVFAAWTFLGPALDTSNDVSSSLSGFSYGPFYITKVEVVGGDYSSADVKKVSDTNISADISLNKNTSSTVVADITFYNSTDASYYYNEEQIVSTDNDKISCTVSGIEQKEEIPSKSYKTITATFGFNSNNTSKTDLLSEIHFNFVVDKDSIGIVVAQSAVTRFEDIINSVVSADSYSTLKNAMNNRGSNASTVSYIGNVSGAHDDDSALIEELFTKEFLSMDLDGDGVSEPITMMIKRENLDNNIYTGDDYTYKNFWGQSRTVQGTEMTIYITSEGFSSRTLTVYAATYTLLEGADKWTQVVPLTKGTASANNYSSGEFGTDNSFNTDTWKSEDGKTIDTLVQNAMK